MQLKLKNIKTGKMHATSCHLAHDTGISDLQYYELTERNTQRACDALGLDYNDLCEELRQSLGYEDCVKMPTIESIPSGSLQMVTAGDYSPWNTPGSPVIEFQPARNKS